MKHIGERTIKLYSLKDCDQGECYGKEYINTLKIGDVVGIVAMISDEEFSKYFVQITKMDNYKYGGIYKVRKYHGTTVEICYQRWDILHKGDTLTFRKENIVDTTYKRILNRSIQRKSNNIDMYLKRQYAFELKRENEEYGCFIAKKKKKLK